MDYLLWLKMKKWPLYISFLVVFIALPVAVFLATKQRAIFFGKAAQEQHVQLWLWPATIKMNLGEEQEIEVFLGTKEKVSGGVDLLLKYDPQKIEIVDNSIKPGFIFNYYRDRLVDNRRGIIRLSSKGKFSGQGVFASFTVKGVSGGETKIKMMTAKETTDSSVVWDEFEQNNLLGEAGNLSMTVY